MAMLSLYLDTSVWNYLFNDHLPEMQAQTRAFLDRLQSDRSVRSFLSDVVLDELGDAPEARSPRLTALIGQVSPARLLLDDESAALAEAYLQHQILTRNHLINARHVAIATVARLDALVSWNYRHLVNRRRREAFNGVNAILGYDPIEIISPPEVFDEWPSGPRHGRGLGLEAPGRGSHPRHESRRIDRVLSPQGR